MASKKKTSKKVNAKKVSSTKKKSSKTTRKAKTGNAQKRSEMTSGSGSYMKVKKAGSSAKKKSAKKKSAEKAPLASDVSTYLVYLDGIVLPVTPQKLDQEFENRNETIELISKGQVSRPRKPGLTTFTISDIMLPMIQNYHFANYQKKFRSPKYYLEKLESWKINKSKIDFVYARQIAGKGLYDTAMKVTVEEYKTHEDADSGLDVYVDITLKQWKPWGGKKLVISRKKNGKKKSRVKKSRTSSRKNPKTVTVKKGDSLRKLAKMYLGSSSKWNSLYSLNKAAIEKAAKKNGRKSSSNGTFLYPGTAIRLSKG